MTRAGLLLCRGELAPRACTTSHLNHGSFQHLGGPASSPTWQPYSAPLLCKRPAPGRPGGRCGGEGEGRLAASDRPPRRARASPPHLLQQPTLPSLLAESPQWRRGPPNKPILCNACGTRYRWDRPRRGAGLVCLRLRRRHPYPAHRAAMRTLETSGQRHQAGGVGMAQARPSAAVPASAAAPFFAHALTHQHPHSLTCALAPRPILPPPAGVPASSTTQRRTPPAASVPRTATARERWRARRLGRSSSPGWWPERVRALRSAVLRGAAAVGLV